MTIQQFYTTNQHQFTFSTAKASQFAKEVAGDFNPLHDPDNNRFCVPGDLLFSTIVNEFGLYKHMSFSFSGMVGSEKRLRIKQLDHELYLEDETGKTYVDVSVSGDKTQNTARIEALIFSYVAFSGQTFPHLLIPLLNDKQVMINPQRPMVIYKSMKIQLDHFDWQNIALELDTEKTYFENNGKRGTAHFHFLFKDKHETIGRGSKEMIISGLKPLDQTVVSQIIELYNQNKKNYHAD